MEIECIAKNITKAGIRAELDMDKTPAIIFIARDHHYINKMFNEVEEGDHISVKIIGQRFELNDTNISAIAELIKINKVSKKLDIKNKSIIKSSPQIDAPPEDQIDALPEEQTDAPPEQQIDAPPEQQIDAPPEQQIDAPQEQQEKLNKNEVEEDKLFEYDAIKALEELEKNENKDKLEKVEDKPLEVPKRKRGRPKKIQQQ